MGKFTDYKLPLKSLPEGTHEYEYHLDKVFFKNMESEDVHNADLLVKLTVVHKSDLYDLTFNIEGVVTLICDRCLDDLEMPIDTTYHISVRYGDEYNDESDDLLVIPEADNYLNTAYMIYDTVVLSIPIKHVHPMGKCNRQMSAMLKKHRATERGASDEDTELEESLIEEIDSIDAGAALPEQPADPRWDALRKLAAEGDAAQTSADE